MTVQPGSLLRPLYAGILAACLLAQTAVCGVTAKGLDEHGLALVAAGSPAFAGLVDRIAGRTRTVEVENLLPFSVMLVNSSKKRVVFYAVRWTSTSNDGVTTSDDRTYSNLTNLRGGYTVDPGAAWFVSVIEAWNRPLKGGDQTAFSSRFHQSRMDLQFRQQSHVAITLDLAIFADGEVVGPDAARTLEQAQARLDAARDLTTAFEEHSRRREPASVYIGWLRQVAGNATADASSRWYRHHRKQLAEELIRIHEQGGENAVRDRLHLAFRTNLKLNR